LNWERKANDKIICPDPMKLVTKEEEILNEANINVTTRPLFISGQ
jgi:hypothetical protein